MRFKCPKCIKYVVDLPFEKGQFLCETFYTDHLCPTCGVRCRTELYVGDTKDSR